MQLNSMVRKGLLAVLIGAATVTLSFGADANFEGSRVIVPSSKPFAEVSDMVKSLVTKSGMMVMAEVDQGNMLSMAGIKLNAKLYLIGSPTVGKQLFEQDHAVGLYVPLRVFVYSDSAGKTFVAYDKPSSVLGQFHNKKIGMVAQMLDGKLSDLANMAAK